jgi:hypothetical protein
MNTRTVRPIAGVLLAILTGVAALPLLPVGPAAAATPRADTNVASIRLTPVVREFRTGEHLHRLATVPGSGIEVEAIYNVNDASARPQDVECCGISVGIGTKIYIRYSPENQRIALQAGAAFVAAATCAVTAGLGCAIAGTAAGAIAAAISEYYNHACWIEVQLNYDASIHAVDRYWRC